MPHTIHFRLPGIDEIAKKSAAYARADMRADMTAGLTVAVMGVPQAMAYALIAGLPPVYGLHTAIVTCLAAAALGGSSHLVTGPTNALCMVILSLTAHLPAKYDVSLIETVFLLTFMTGMFQLAFGALRMGGVVRYVSNSVVVGFTAGAGILIAGNQLKNVLGVNLGGAHLERFHEVLWATAEHLPQTNPFALFIGALTAALVLLLPKIDRRLPGALIAVAGTGALAYVLGWHEPAMAGSRVEIVRDIEPVRGSLRIFHPPRLLFDFNYELTRELGAGAVALAILGLIEAASIARAIASSSGQRLNFTREFAGQGIANMAGSFFSCFAGSGSFTRSAVCYKSGGRTRMAAVFSALWTALTLVTFGPLANYIPKASLAGILIIIAYSMIDKHRMRLAWKSGKNSRLVLGATLASTLLLPLEYAIFAGVFLSIVLLLRITGKADLTQLVQQPGAGFEEIPFNRAAPSPVVLVNMEGDLYFAAVEDLDYEMLRCLTPETRVVVLRMKRLRAVGSTAMAILEHFSELLRSRGIRLVACGIEDELTSLMTSSGLRQKIGEQNIFYADNKLFQSTELAMARAWSIVEMERSRAKAAGKSRPAAASPAAGQIMSRRCIRFGNQHQLREAIWLMSEILRNTQSLTAQPLFLQDREGKLAGELTPLQVLKEMINGIDPAQAVLMEDRALARQIRKNFTKTITTLVRSGIPRLSRDASIAQVLQASARHGMPVVPVCDEDGRLMGLVDQNVMLDELIKALNLTPKEKHHD